MGEVHAELTLTNLFSRQHAQVRALVDTGASEMIVTAAVAAALGFDLEEVARKNVCLADGRWVEAACIRPIEIRFEDRTYCADVLVLGNECLMGHIPLQGLDLIVDPKLQRLKGRFAEGPVARA